MRKIHQTSCRNSLFFIFLLSACDTPFGVEWVLSNDKPLIKDMMTASSNDLKHPPHLGRLNHPNNSWCPSDNSIQNHYTRKEQYLQIDFIFPSIITGVTTQGFDSKYVESYHLYYALDINMFHYYVDDNGQYKVSHILCRLQWNPDFSNPRFLNNPDNSNQKSFGLGFVSL